MTSVALRPQYVEAISDPEARVREPPRRHSAGWSRMRQFALCWTGSTSTDLPEAGRPSWRHRGKRHARGLQDGGGRPRKEEPSGSAAVSAIVRFAKPDAEAALRPYAADADLDFRETVLLTLAEKLRVPIDAGLLAPVIRLRAAHAPSAMRRGCCGCTRTTRPLRRCSAAWTLTIRRFDITTT